MQLTITHIFLDYLGMSHSHFQVISHHVISHHISDTTVLTFKT